MLRTLLPPFRSSILTQLHCKAVPIQFLVMELPQGRKGAASVNDNYPPRPTTVFQCFKSPTRCVDRPRFFFR
jgi:hypothetical protein